MKSQHLPIVLLLIISLTVNAEVTLDGTLGPRGPLPGPDYLIGAELGRQMGGNLFHSFQDFNLSQYESATFSGPNSVQTLIGRVTGGNPSNIDGLIRSTMPGADMYFINPYGIMFGPNAQLDVQGSFHASTADYLRLGNGGRFDARQPHESLLTVAPVEAFGFLTQSPAAITTNDSHLSVPDGQTLSLIGGDLRLNGESPIQFDGTGFAAVFARSKLGAASGRINLASVASIGEVIPREFELDLTAEGGKITANNTLIETSGRGSGRIFIRGGQFVMRDAVIQANTLADQDGTGIDLHLTESINISGNSLAISSSTFGTGHAGHLAITTPVMDISESFVYATTFGEGNAGNIAINSHQMSLSKGTIVASDSYGSGTGGQLNITATDLLSLSDQRLFFDKKEAKFSTGLSSGSFNTGKGGQITIKTGQLNLSGGVVISNTHQAGDAGTIVINANKVSITRGGLISATALSQASGTGGHLDITATDTLHLSGFRPGLTRTTTDVFNNLQSSIATITFGKGLAGNISVSATDVILENYGSIGAATGGSGNAGNMVLEVENLYLTDGGLLTNSSGGIVGGHTYLGTGAGGTLKVVASGDIVASGRNDFTPSGIFTNTLVSGEGGNIEIQANQLTLTEGATISANSLGIGNAGEISIQANTIHLTHSGNITTSAEHATGGNITLTTPNLLYLRDGQITTSVGAGTGQGGDITLSNPRFVVLDKGIIKAQADAGRGGDIHIQSNQLIQSNDSLVSASSRLGIDGKVDIDSPTVNMEDFLVVLPGGFIENAQLPQPCNIQDVSDLSTFQVHTQHEGLLRMPKNFME